MASRRLRVVVRDLEQFIDRLIIAVVLEVVANLRRAPSEGGTPVDTGWARANWIPAIGAPAKTGPQPTSRSARAAAASGALGRSESGVVAVATTYRFRMGPIFISNPVPYIVNLNAGSSRQAPAMFVERAIFDGIKGVVTKFGGRQTGGGRL